MRYLSKSTIAARSRILIFAALGILVLSGCVSRRNGVSWADLAVVGADQDILVSFRDYMVLIDPVTGQPVPLVDDEGNIRVDADGNPRHWEVQNDGSEFYSSPIFVDNELMLVADYNERLLTVNFPSARVEDPAGVSIPGHVIVNLTTNEAGTIVYLPLSNRDLVAYDIETMTELWRWETDRGIWADLVIRDDVIYLASIDHHVYALNAETGDLIWQLDLDGGVAAAPAIGEDRLYVGTLDRKIFMVSLDGEIIGEPLAMEDWVWSTPVLVDGVLYATDLSGRVYAAEPTDEGFNLIWKIKASDDGIRSSPVVTDTHVIVADRGGRIFWFNRSDGQPVMVEGADGLEPLEREVGSEILSDMLVIHRQTQEDGTTADGNSEERSDLLIVSTVNNGRLLVAFTLDDGIRRWDFGR